MILGIGADIIAVNRFKNWNVFSYNQLRRVFSKEELSYCKDNNDYNVQALAARFAAKEAFFKALSALLVRSGDTDYEFSLLFLCQHCKVIQGVWGVPHLFVNWNGIEKKIKRSLHDIGIGFSLSHEKEYAIAYVVLHCVGKK